MTPKCEFGRDYCTVHLPAKFHPPMFTRLEVVMLTSTQTNKQTPLKTSNTLRYATMLGNHQFILSVFLLLQTSQYVKQFPCSFAVRFIFSIVETLVRKILGVTINH